MGKVEWSMPMATITKAIGLKTSGTGKVYTFLLMENDIRDDSKMEKCMSMIETIETE